MLPESRRVAALMLTAPTRQAWVHALRVDNVLQKNTPATAMRVGRLIRARLDTLPEAGWLLIAQGPQEAALQSLLAAAMLHSRLLTDFMRDVVAAHHHKLDPALIRQDWPPFLADCAARDPASARWSRSTQTKLWQVLIRILTEGRYLESAQTLRLRSPGLHPDVRRMLEKSGHTPLIHTLNLELRP
jgi:hypothetical protein